MISLHYSCGWSVKIPDQHMNHIFIFVFSFSSLSIWSLHCQFIERFNEVVKLLWTRGDFSWRWGNWWGICSYTYSHLEGSNNIWGMQIGEVSGPRRKSSSFVQCTLYTRKVIWGRTQLGHWPCMELASTILFSTF